MKYLFVAPSLTPPTYETFEQQVYKSFAKIDKLMANEDATLRVSVTKDGEEFSVTAELWNSENLLSKEKNRDLRAAIDIVSKEIKTQLLKNKDKRGLRKMSDKVVNLRNKLLNRNVE